MTSTRPAAEVAMDGDEGGSQPNTRTKMATVEPALIHVTTCDATLSHTEQTRMQPE